MSTTLWIVNQYAGSKHHGKHYRSYYIAKELTRRGYDVTIIAGSHSHHFSTFPEVDRDYTVEMIDGIRYMWVRMPHYRSSKSIARAWHMLLFAWKLLWMPVNMLPKPDIIVVSSPSPFPILNAAIWSRKFSAVKVFEVRDLWPLSVMHLGDLSSKNPFVWLLQKVENFAYRESAAVISLLPHAKANMVEHGLPPQRFHYIPNGIDPEELPTEVSADREIASMIPKGAFVVGYLGALGIANNLTHLIDAARLLQSEEKIHFLLVGEGSEEQSLRAYATGLRNVTFAGAVPKSRVPSVLKLFDLCFISLKKEALFQYGVSPNKMFDYMAAAKPVLYAVESGNNMVEEAECGVQVDPQNIGEIAEAIQKMSRFDPKVLRQWGGNGYNFLLRHHSFPVLAQNYCDVLQQTTCKDSYD